MDILSQFRICLDVKHGCCRTFGRCSRRSNHLLIQQRRPSNPCNPLSRVSTKTLGNSQLRLCRNVLRGSGMTTQMLLWRGRLASIRPSALITYGMRCITSHRSNTYVSLWNCKLPTLYHWACMSVVYDDMFKSSCVGCNVLKSISQNFN